MRNIAVQIKSSLGIRRSPRRNDNEFSPKSEQKLKKLHMTVYSTNQFDVSNIHSTPITPASKHNISNFQKLENPQVQMIKQKQATIQKTYQMQLECSRSNLEKELQARVKHFEIAKLKLEIKQQQVMMDKAQRKMLEKKRELEEREYI